MMKGFISRTAVAAPAQATRRTGVLVRLAEDNSAWLAGSMVVALVGAALAAPILAPSDPTAIDLANALAPPSADSVLGRDALGRDVLARILHGARLSLLLGCVTVLLAGGLGSALGLVAGYYRGVPDSVISRLTDVQLAFPPMLLAIAVVATLGPGLFSLVLAVAVSTVPSFTRLVRGVVLGLATRDFVIGAYAVGAGAGRIMFKHLLPNCLAVIVVQASLRLSTVILTASGLSFLGLGVQPPMPEWGAMLSDSRRYLLLAPHIPTTVGLALLLTVLAFNLLGDAVRDALDPKLAT